MEEDTGLSCPFTFSLSGENLSVSLSQGALLSVPNGALSGCMRAFAWPSGDVALLPLKSQNHRDVRGEKERGSAWRERFRWPSGGLQEDSVDDRMLRAELPVASD